MSQKIPIAECKIRMNSVETLDEIKKFIHLISNELNCLELSYGTYDTELEYSVELNHREIGREYRNVANDIKTKITEISQEELIEIEKTNNMTISVNNITYNIKPTMYNIKKVPKKGQNIVLDGDMMIQFDFTYNDIIKHRHVANCFVTHFQNHRKRVGLRPWNKVDLAIINDNNKIITNHQELKIDTI